MKRIFILFLVIGMALSGCKATSDVKNSQLVTHVEYNDFTELERITKGALGNNFDYEIYYYGIEAFYVKINGKTLELREALEKDPEILDKLYGQWEKDSGRNTLFYDGGSAQYEYDTYTAIKFHSKELYVSPEDLKVVHNHPFEDLVFCKPGTSIDEAKDRIMIGNIRISGTKEDMIFSASSSIDPLPLSFVLHKNGRFAFRFSSVSNFTARGTYSKNGNKMIMQTQGEFDYRYVFEQVDGGYRFVAAESTKIPFFQYGENSEPICPLLDETLFKPQA